MAQVTKVCGTVAAVALLAVPYASAQAPAPSTSKFFVSVDAGAQLAPRSITMGATQTVYDETATLNASVDVGKGFVPGFAVGYRVFGDVFVGVGVTMFSNTGDAAYTASIPDPLFFNRNKTVSGTVTGLEHKETAILPTISYARPLTDKIDVVGGIGPSIIRLSQDTVSSFTVAAGTQNVTVGKSTEDGSATGINASIGLNYNLTERFAIGGFARYAGAKVALPSFADKQNVGGMQAGGGLRINF